MWKITKHQNNNENIFDSIFYNAKKIQENI